MTQQIGKHNASGPTARRRDGTIDPSAYLKSRLSDRRNLAYHAVLLIGWGVIWSVRGGNGASVVLVMIASLLLAEFGGAYIFKAVVGRREQRRRKTGLSPSWAASLIAVLQAREAGFSLPPSYPNDAVVSGRLSCEGSQWVWTAAANRRHPDRARLVFNPGWSPLCSRRFGTRTVVSFIDAETRRVDFFCRDWRDLRHHLNSRW